MCLGFSVAIGSGSAEQLLKPLSTATDSKILRECLREITSDLGFDFFALIHHVDLRMPRPGVIHFDNYPVVWSEHFISNGLYVDDPVLHASTRAAIGFPWTAVPDMVRLTSRRRRILESALREGIGPGFTVPSNIPGERHGSCSFAVRLGRDLPERSLMLTQLVGLFAFAAARRIVLAAERATNPPHLSPKQRDCVVLAGQGKSDSVIAQLLGLSENTVTNYLAAARERYDVATRTQLVTCALADGEIGFSEVDTRH